jgi:hypothetical protein
MKGFTFSDDSPFPSFLGARSDPLLLGGLASILHEITRELFETCRH